MVEKSAAIDFTKYLYQGEKKTRCLLPPTKFLQNETTSQLTISSANRQLESQNETVRNNEMPALRFRDYICSGLSKKDEDQLARTSSAYRQLEF